MLNYYIIGAGGQARQVASVLYAANPEVKIKAFLDRYDNKGTYYLHNIPVLSEAILDLAPPGEVMLVNGLGRPNRQKPLERLCSKGFSFLKLIHPQATIGKYVTIGEGTVIQSCVQFMTDVTIGKFVLVDLLSTIGHDAIVGDYTTISTGVNLAGGVNVGKGTWIGTGSVIIEGIKIGDNSVIGAGSVVTHDIGSNKLAYGTPAKEIRDIEDASDTLMKNHRQ